MFRKKKTVITPFTCIDLMAELMKNNGTSQRQELARRYLSKATPTDLDAIWCGPCTGAINQLSRDFEKAGQDILQILGPGLGQYNDAVIANLVKVLDPKSSYDRKRFALGRTVGIIEQMPVSSTMIEIVLRALRHGNTTLLLTDAYQVAEQVARHRHQKHGLSGAERSDWINYLMAHDGNKHLKTIEVILSHLERKDLEAVA